ncbi:MAG: 4-hydroxy-3-methylbut-2-enyl diphosphate reductase [Lachnospiraceae bacterium]|nr:4-hydroxy-3-methylbut-2-enyl diphosphate reductase [Lachnospiraceae bacterium]
MEVNVAKSAGFCFGVKRAVDTVYNEIQNSDNIYTYGPIIHNEEVVADLEKKGVKVISEGENPSEFPKGTVIIRSHGVGKKIYDDLENCGHKIVDATCPFVKKIHNIVKEQSENDVQVIVIGNRNHPEVVGIIGWCDEKKPAIIVENSEEAEKFSISKDEKLCIVSQTTFNLNKFNELVEIFKKKGYYTYVGNTICNATEVRQSEAKSIAESSDAVIVIGGLSSSNTQKLYEICRRECDNTQYIQTLNDLDVDSLRDVKRVGITAGASTPNNIIEEVQNYVRINF